MKSIFLSVLCSLLIAHHADAQIIIVRDSETAQPIELVNIFSEDPPLQTTTNSMGEAEISAFRGAEKITINHLGYLGMVKSFDELKADAFLVWLSPALETVGQVVITANRWKQPATSQPARTTVVTSRDIALQNPQTAADVLGSSGEVFIQKSQQGGGSPMIRGFSTNRLLYVVDGVRMNTAIFRSGNIQNVISLDPFATEQAEVYFGPGSVMYGSDAIGGVMKFQTLSPHFAKDNGRLVSGNIVSRYSSANQEKTVHFDVSVANKRWASLTSFSSHDFDDLKMGRYGPQEYLRPFYVQRQGETDVIVANDDPLIQRPSGYSQINLMQKFAVNASENWLVEYGFHYSETSSYGRYDRHIRYRPNGQPRSAQWDYGPQIWMMNNLSATYKGQRGLFDELVIRVAHQRFEESRIDRNFNNAIRRNREERVDALSVNLDFLKKINESHTVFYGAEVVENRVLSTGTDTDINTGNNVQGPARYPNSDWRAMGAYVTESWKVNKKFLIQSGVRWNSYSLDARFDTTFYPFPFVTADLANAAFTGSLGAVWTPDEKTTMRINGATGFRSPNVDDLGKVFDSAPGIVVVPNPSLNSEYVSNIELGAARILGSWLSLDATAYFSQLNNALVRRNFQLNGSDSLIYDGEMSRVQAIQNAAFMQVYGIQAGMEVRFLNHFSWLSRVNFQRGEEELEDGTRSPARHAAPMFGSSRLRYSSKGLTMEIAALFSEGRTFDQLPREEQDKTEIYAQDKQGKPYSPGWHCLNFRVSYLVDKNWTISAGVENLTDRRYRPYSSGIAAAGRNVVISTRLKF